MGAGVLVSVIALAWSAFICPVLCIRCELSDTAGPPDGGFLVYSQQDLSQHLSQLGANCTELDGFMMLAYNYTGSIVLDGITALTGLISDNSEVRREKRPFNDANPYVTSISMPDMLSLGQLNFPNTTSLMNVSVPRATQIGMISMGDLPGTEFDFKSATQVSQAWLNGKISGVYFDSLVQINGSIEINAAPGSELILDCPRLQSLTSLSVSGNINSLILPELRGIIQYGYRSSDDLTIQVDNGNTPFDISLPRLSQVSSPSFKGSIGSINLPALLEVNQSLAISATLPLFVNLTYLQSADGISLDGNITGAEFPALKHVQTIAINSGVSMNCTPALTAYELYHTNSTPNSFACYTPEPKPAPHKSLSLGAKLGIGIGVGVGVLVIILILSLWKLYQKKRENIRLQTTIKLQQVNADGETLPDYQTAVGITVRRRATLQGGETTVPPAE